ncbi:MAG: hypothetical protein ACRC2T_18080 [Thermoguttaceae bacterium]
MKIIGLDEAGYGPNLGPLVISASCWSLNNIGDSVHENHDFKLEYKPTIPQYIKNADLSTSPEEILRAKLTKCGAISSSVKDVTSGKAIITVADSKILYKAGKKTDSLEILRHTVGTVRGVLACPPKNRSTKSVNPVVSYVSCSRKCGKWCEFDDYAEVDANVVAKLRAALNVAEVEILALESWLIFPCEFNELIEKTDSKGTAHAEAVIGLMRQMVDSFRTENEPVYIFCDKLGGRNHYANLLYPHFADLTSGLIETVCESAEKSEYVIQKQNKPPIRIRFQVRGESLVPIALASIASKYLRELAMQKFNVFWQQHVPNLTPTAGYPVDARRFKAEIQPAQKKLRISDAVIWRVR